MLTQVDLIDYIRSKDLILRSWGNNDVIRNLNFLWKALWTEENEKITGVVIFTVDEALKTVHVIAIQTETIKPFKFFLSIFQRSFHGFSLTATRKSKFKVYNVPRLCKLILK